MCVNWSRQASPAHRLHHQSVKCLPLSTGIQPAYHNKTLIVSVHIFYVLVEIPLGVFYQTLKVCHCFILLYLLLHATIENIGPVEK